MKSFAIISTRLSMVRVSSFLMSNQHNIGYAVPYHKVKQATVESDAAAQSKHQPKSKPVCYCCNNFFCQPTFISFGTYTLYQINNWRMYS